MNIVRTVTLVAGSVGLAIAAGTLFQSGSEPGSAELNPRAVAEQSPAVASLMPPSGEPAARSTMISGSGRSVPSLIPDAQVGTAALQAAPELDQQIGTLDETAAAEPTASADARLAQAEPSPGALPVASDVTDCEASLVVMPLPSAMLEISLYAPCHANSPALLAHGPLRLPVQLGAAGELVEIVPALSSEAQVSARLADGVELSDLAPVPDFAAYDRYLLQSEGDTPVELHAYLPGAQFGGEGHVTTGSAPSEAAGFVTALAGSEGRHYRLYTWPAGEAAASSPILLETEIGVTAQSCGQSFKVDAWLVSSASGVIQGEIDLVLPDCAAAGGFVALQGLAMEIPEQQAVTQ